MTALRKNISLILTSILILTFATLIIGANIKSPSAPAVVYYVDDDSCPATGSGTEQDPYCQIQTAVDNAGSGVEIRVAEGTYTGIDSRPDSQGHEYWQVVYIDKSLILRGGYDDNDWNAPRDPSDYPSVIDAERGGRGVTIVGTSSDEVILDGFTITGGDYATLGNEDGQSGVLCSRTGYDCGGGMFAKSVRVDLLNSWVYDNYASPKDSGEPSDGGGVYYWNVASGSTMQNTTVISNTVSGPNGGGGGMYISHGDAVTISNSRFVDNYSTSEGGGLMVFQPEEKLIIERTDFFSNYADDFGGALRIHTAMEGDALEMDRVRMSKNIAYLDGTSMYLIQQGSDPTSARLMNLVFDGSSSHTNDSQASVLFLDNTSSFDLLIDHVTASGNSPATFLEAASDEDEGDVFTITTSNVLLESFVNGYYGKQYGSGILNINYVNTLFDNVTNFDVSAVGSPTFNATNVMTGTSGLIDAFHLSLNSTARDAGVDVGVSYDYDGDPRDDNYPDIGADEYQPRLYLPFLLNSLK
jgi:hypothetical protein